MDKQLQFSDKGKSVLQIDRQTDIFRCIYNSELTTCKQTRQVNWGQFSEREIKKIEGQAEADCKAEKGIY
jgi:hypothetical protein